MINSQKMVCADSDRDLESVTESRSRRKIKVPYSGWFLVVKAMIFMEILIFEAGKIHSLFRDNPITEIDLTKKPIT